MNSGGQLRLRFLRAYWVTLVVLNSYLWTRLVANLRGDAWFRQAIQEKHVLNARRIQRAIIKLQGLFIKVGQTFSILTNFLPPEFRAELEGLQDSVPPRPYGAIVARFREDFGKEPREIFTDFDETPLAAASISQVHLATLADGRQVAVKIQYPDIDDMVESDLRTFRRILQIVSMFVQTQGLDVVYREVAIMLRAELDFKAEARHIGRIAKDFEGVEGIAFPEVHPDFSTAHILTTGFVDAVKVTDMAGLEAAGHDNKLLARRLVDVYCQQIFVHGFYHADPHPGNVLVSSDGTLTLLDFGAVSTVSEGMRRGIAHFLQAVMNQDTERIAQALKEMGFISRHHDEEVFERVVAYFHEKFQESITLESFNLQDIKVDPEMGLEHLLALRQMDIGIGELSSVFQIPSEWILLERTILLLTGMCTHLDAEVRPMELVRPYLRDFLLGEDGDWSAFLVDTGKEVAVQFLGLPAELRRFLSRASSGRLQVQVKGLAHHTQAMYALGHQLIYALVAMGAGGVGAYLKIHGSKSDAEAAFLAAGIATVFFLGSVWRQSRNRPSK